MGSTPGHCLLLVFIYFHLITTNILTCQEAIINTSCILFSSSQNGMTGLMHAAYKGNTEACNTLLENGADVNSNFQSDGVQNNLGLIPILNRLGNEAIHNVRQPCVLCDYCLPFSTLQYTPLMFATIAGDCLFAFPFSPSFLPCALLSSLPPLPPYFLSKAPHSLLLSLPQLGHANTVELLLQAGAKTNTVNNAGKTAVQLGAFVGESLTSLIPRPHGQREKWPGYEASLHRYISYIFLVYREAKH